jgi:hypothetical protein
MSEHGGRVGPCVKNDNLLQADFVGDSLPCPPDVPRLRPGLYRVANIERPLLVPGGKIKEEKLKLHLRIHADTFCFKTISDSSCTLI